MKTALLTLALAIAVPARAESGQVNLHLEPGAAMMMMPPQSSMFHPGFGASLKADYRFTSLVSFELSGSALNFPTDQFSQPGRAYTGGVGVRLRLVDDDQGYLWHVGDKTDHEGNWFGNLWIDAGAQVVGTGPLVRPGVSVAAGLETSLFDEVQIGPFVQYQHVFHPPSPGLMPNDAFVFIAGLSTSVGFPYTSVHVARKEAPKPPPEPEAVAVAAPDPNRDSDGDGIPDRIDKCPNAPEVFNGIEDDDGCPDQGDALVVLTRDQIEIRKPLKFDKVQFGSAEWRVSKSSYLVMATVAKILFLHPEIKRVRIEGHTDNVGDHAFNSELSNKRAAAVLSHLVEVNGVEAERLESQGYAYDRPLAPNDTEAGRARNRRVEFHITSREEATR